MLLIVLFIKYFYLQCYEKSNLNSLNGPVEHSVASPTADPGVASLIQVRSHTFVEIDHKTISSVTLLPSADSRRVVVSYKQNMFMKYWLTAWSSLLGKNYDYVNCLDMTIAVD